MAWMLRFIDNVKVSASQRKLHNEITLLEREKATSHVLRLLQRSAYGKEYESLERNEIGKSHLIKQLNLYLDNGLIRCRGRLEKSDLPEESKYPLLLPKGHPVTLILIREAHEAVAHMGLNATVAKVRQRYWIT